jgi:multiple sugar transport system permease protein
LILPALAYLIALSTYPLLYSLGLSFTNYDPTHPTQPIGFIGLDNYLSFLIGDNRFTVALMNTVLYAVTAVSLEFFIGLGLAVLLNREMRGSRVFQALLLTPMMVAPVITGHIWRMLLDAQYGPINYFLIALGISKAGVAWLGSTSTALFSVVVAEVWQWTPFVMLVLLAGMKAIPQTPYEAAQIDGASAWQTFRYLTWPMLGPLVTLILIIRTMDVFKLFDVIYTLTSGGPGNTTETLSFYIYIKGMVAMRIGVASAMSWIVVIIVTILALSFIRLLSARSE